MISKDESSPTGGAWAAILAAGIGCLCFGVAVDLSEMSKRISALLNLYSPAGDLTGKSTVGVAAWLVAWAVLHARWKGRNIQRPVAVSVVCVICVLIGLVLVFPPFVEMIKGE